MRDKPLVILLFVIVLITGIATVVFSLKYGFTSDDLTQACKVLHAHGLTSKGC